MALLYNEKEYTIKINSQFNNKPFWIKIRRNNQYIPCNRWKDFKYPSNKEGGWCVVKTKKNAHEKYHTPQPIYYWVVTDHNLFDVNDKSFRLFFTEPDSTQIENIDRNNYMAIDKDRQLRLIHIHLKHKGMKMTPTYYIARNIQQIENALQYVRYCVVKIENNEQILVEPEGGET